MNQILSLQTALLLRELATSISKADYPARNGLFLELHRLHDTIFRLALESHPAAPPDLAGQAFSVESMPTPQVIRELRLLNSSLVSPQIHKLHKHMNMVRNNMAHKTILERVPVSHTNAKAMAHLANLIANELDPRPRQMPDIQQSRAPRPIWHEKALYLSLALLAAIVLSWVIIVFLI